MLLSGHFLCLTITILIYKHEKIIRIFLSLWFSLINDIIIFDSGEAKQNFKKLRTKQLNFVSYLAEMIFVIYKWRRFDTVCNSAVFCWDQHRCALVYTKWNKFWEDMHHVPLVSFNYIFIFYRCNTPLF